VTVSYILLSLEVCMKTVLWVFAVLLITVGMQKGFSKEKYSMNGIDMNNCVYCHSYNVNANVGGHVFVSRCDLCHAGHRQKTANPHRLLRSVNDTCLECHDDLPRSGHPINKHPIKGKKDPLYPKKEFSCASCHNPHGSDMPKLFRYKYEEGFGDMMMCVLCHRGKYALGLPVGPIPPWNFWK